MVLVCTSRFWMETRSNHKRPTNKPKGKEPLYQLGIAWFHSLLCTSWDFSYSQWSHGALFPPCNYRACCENTKVFFLSFFAFPFVYSFTPHPLFNSAFPSYPYPSCHFFTSHSFTSTKLTCNVDLWTWDTLREWSWRKERTSPWLALRNYGCATPSPSLPPCHSRTTASWSTPRTPLSSTCMGTAWRSRTARERSWRWKRSTPPYWKYLPRRRASWRRRVVCLSRFLWTTPALPLFRYTPSFFSFTFPFHSFFSPRFPSFSLLFSFLSAQLTLL